jgi:hypothetical protein
LVLLRSQRWCCADLERNRIPDSWGSRAEGSRAENGFRCNSVKELLVRGAKIARGCIEVEQGGEVLWGGGRECLAGYGSQLEVDSAVNREPVKLFE